MAGDDLDIPESRTPEERRIRKHFERHRTAFVLGFLPIVFGVVFGRTIVVGVILFAIAGGCWLVSGLSAISAKQHMFAGLSGGGMGYVKVRPSGHSPIAATIIGVILILLALGLFNVAVQLALAAA